MADTSVPFNIDLLTPTNKDFSGMEPVTSLSIFEGATKQFHNDGLFSTTKFGRIGDVSRSRRYSYIDFKLPVFHPVIYNTLGKLKRLYLEIISGKTYATWDKVEKDFVKSNQLDGQTGFHFFEQHWKDIVFKENNSDTRTENIRLIKKFKERSLTSLLVVMPAGLRDYEIKDNGQEEEEEINTLYRKMLSLANSISVNAFKSTPELYNQSRVNIQYTFVDIYELILGSIKGKKKLYMGKWASRAIHDSTRNVITTTNVNIQNLGDPLNPGFNHTIVGLYQVAKAIAPITRFRLREILGKSFIDPKLPISVVDNKTLGKKTVIVKPSEFDLWMTDEGLDKIINTFGVEHLRQKPITIGGEFLALLYNNGKTFKIFYDIEELPNPEMVEHVKPLRFCDLFYIALFPVAGNYPALITRYPITGFGSIYPSYMYMRSTVDSQRLTMLGDDWQPTDVIAPEFPAEGSFFNSVSPSPSRLSGLGAD